LIVVVISLIRFLLRLLNEDSTNDEVLCKTCSLVKTTSEKPELTVLRLAVWPLVVKNDNCNQTTTSLRSPLKDNLSLSVHHLAIAWRSRWRTAGCNLDKTA
jgi:hypothetical protein